MTKFTRDLFCCWALEIVTRTFQKTISYEYIAYLKIVHTEMLNVFNMCISWPVVTKYSPRLLTEYKPRECKDLYITFLRLLWLELKFKILNFDEWEQNRDFNTNKSEFEK